MADITTSPAPHVGRAAFTFILIMVAFDFLAFGIIVPVLPDLIRSGFSLAVVGVSAAIVSGVLVGPFVKHFGDLCDVAK